MRGDSLLPGWPGAGAFPGVCAIMGAMAGAVAPAAGDCAAAAGTWAAAAGVCAVAAGCVAAAGVCAVAAGCAAAATGGDAPAAAAGEVEGEVLPCTGMPKNNNQLAMLLFLVIITRISCLEARSVCRQAAQAVKHRGCHKPYLLMENHIQAKFNQPWVRCSAKGLCQGTAILSKRHSPVYTVRCAHARQQAALTDTSAFCR